jgi:hypothetical protein
MTFVRIVAALLILSAPACAEEDEIVQDQGPGIAVNYPGDVGIEQDPSVIFVENCEGSIDSFKERWANLNQNKELVTVIDAPPDSSGVQALSMRNNRLYAHTKPVEQLYARYYLKYTDSPTFAHHHLATIIGESEPTPWPIAFSGRKVAGDRFFAASADAWGAAVFAPRKWAFYHYWYDMKPEANGDFWGEHRRVGLGDEIEGGRWYCVEHMVKVNTDGTSSDGEEALWIDGRKVGRMLDLQLRTSSYLKINGFWLLFDAMEPRDGGIESLRLFYDDIVLATEYIGPLAPRQ